MVVARKTTAAKKTAASKPAAESASKVVLDLTIVSPKKGSVRFDSEDPDAVLRSVYINKPFVDDTSNGVRITIEKL